MDARQGFGYDDAACRGSTSLVLQGCRPWAQGQKQCDFPDVAAQVRYQDKKGNAMKLDSSISTVVTGGASGIGEAVVRRLAASGVKVAIFDLNEERGEAIAGELGGVFCKVEVTSKEAVDAGLEKARAAIGQERILVNCPGTGNAHKTASRASRPVKSATSPCQRSKRSSRST